MKLMNKPIKNITQKKMKLKLTTRFSIAFLIAITCNFASYAAFQAPNNIGEVEPNNTRETAQTTYLTNEVAEKFGADDWSGRYSIQGKATSSDDDWYKIDLPEGTQYLTVVHSYGDNATYVELFDSENNIIIPKKYGTRYNVTKFDSERGTYYIHITGASENENRYALFVGTPMLSSDEVTIRFNSVNTYKTIKKTFSLANENILPRDAIVTKITLDNLYPGYSSARISSSSSSKSVSFPYNGDTFATNLGKLDMKLKSTWNAEFNPKSTVKTVPSIRFVYFYPVYDNTEYPPFSKIQK